MKTKSMFAVEFYNCLPNDVESSTYNIYPTIQEAKTFASQMFVLYIFMADFNVNRIYKEESGEWNYEDLSDTLENQFILEDHRPVKRESLVQQ